MDAFESVATKLDIREFSPKQVPPEIKSNVLEAARLTGTGLNTPAKHEVLCLQN